MQPGQDADVLAGRHASPRRHYPAVLWPASPTDASPSFHHCRRRRRRRSCFHCLLPSKLWLTAAVADSDALVLLEVVREALQKRNKIFLFRNKLALSGNNAALKQILTVNNNTKLCFVTNLYLCLCVCASRLLLC